MIWCNCQALHTWHSQSCTCTKYMYSAQQIHNLHPPFSYAKNVWITIVLLSCTHPWTDTHLNLGRVRQFGIRRQAQERKRDDTTNIRTHAQLWPRAILLNHCITTLHHFTNLKKNSHYFLRSQVPGTRYQVSIKLQNSFQSCLERQPTELGLLCPVSHYTKSFIFRLIWNQ
jgi:hypothetical protein